MLNMIRVALFIDAENISADYLPDCLARCRQLGTPTIARCYGGSARLKQWKKAMVEHHIVHMPTPPGVGKNASDFALTIDAVSLLHRDMFDHAVIASSDADFTQLAIHIRKHGKGVYGVGEAKTPAGLQKAYDQFWPVDKELLKSTTAKKPAASSDHRPAATKASDIDTKKLRAIYSELAADGKTVMYQPFIKKLSEQMPGYEKGRGGWKKVLNKSKLFTIDPGSNGEVHLI